MRHLAGIADSVEAAQDAAQEAFVRLWEGRERWTEGSPRALLFRIGRNAAFDLRRRAAVRERAALASTLIADPPPTPAEEYERSELRARLESALASLPARRREVFELTWMHGLSYADASEVLDIAPQTVANLLSLTLRDLRSLLSGRRDDAHADAAHDSRGEAPNG